MNWSPLSLQVPHVRCTLLALATCMTSVLLRAGLPSAAETPHIYDEFDQAGGLNTSVWAYREGPKLDGYNRPDNVALATVTVGGSNYSCVEITGNRAGTHYLGYPYTCGGIKTQEQLGYGYYIIRARLTTKQGWHCSFWGAQQFDTPNALSPWPATNELDAFEIDSADPDQELHFNTHQWRTSGELGQAKVSHVAPALDYTSSSDTSRAETLALPSAGTAFHTYAFEWTPTHAVYYVDGVERARTRYPGPHRPLNALITNQASNYAALGHEDGGKMDVDYFKYYKRDYDLPPSTNATEVLPSIAAGSTWLNSRVAVDADFESGIGDILATHLPDQTVTWDFPAALPTGAYEVFAWNPSVYSAGFLSPDTYTDVDSNHNPVGHPVSYEIAATSPDAGVSVDQTYGGQGWRGLGAHQFTSGAGDGVSLTSIDSPRHITRAGPIVYRRLNLAYDQFSSAGTPPSGWSSLLGTWSASGGTVTDSNLGEAVLVHASAAFTDGFVRTRIWVPSTDGVTSIGLLARQSSAGYYLLRVNYGVTPHKLGLLVKDSAGTFTTLMEETVPDEITLHDDWVDLVLVLSGSNLRGFIDGRLIVTATDTTHAGSGAFGLRTYGDLGKFDDTGAGH